MRVQLNINAEDFSKFYYKEFNTYRITLATVATVAISILLLMNYVNYQRKKGFSYPVIAKKILHSPLYALGYIANRVETLFNHVKECVWQTKTGDDEARPLPPPPPLSRESQKIT